jgi:general secretion pathway protein G
MKTKRNVIEILIYFIFFLFLIGFFAHIVTLISPKQSTAFFIKKEIKIISDGLNRYKKDVGHYPTNDQGLRVLNEKPLGVDGDKWNGPYLKPGRIPYDLWGRDFNYCYPGIHNIKSFDLWSYGRDGKPGGKRKNADIGNW